MSFAPFGVNITYADAEVTLAIVGQVDLRTSPELGRIVDAVIDRGHRNVVVDLTACTYLDASGLGVMAAAADRLNLLTPDVVLTLRSPSIMVRQILEAAELHKVIKVEERQTPTTHPEQSRSGLGTGGGGSGEIDPVDRRVKEIAAIPADRDLVDAALRLVVVLARATVQGADGVSVSLSRHGRLATVAATDQTILEMDADQYATGEGPCVDASMEGRWFHAASLADETRWPAFVPKAHALGINSILSNPLLVDERPVGALNIYSNTPSAFEVNDERLASVFASEASNILAESGARVTDEQLAGRLVDALHAREVIAQAQGILMQRDSFTAEEAYSFLLEYSRRSNRPIRELAGETVSCMFVPHRRSTDTTPMHDG